MYSIAQYQIFYSFRALPVSLIWIQSILKEYYITSLLGENIIATFSNTFTFNYRSTTRDTMLSYHKLLLLFVYTGVCSAKLKACLHLHLFCVQECIHSYLRYIDCTFSNIPKYRTDHCVLIIIAQYNIYLTKFLRKL